MVEIYEYVFYRFRVIALNEVGESKPCEVDGAVTIKDQIEEPSIELDAKMSGKVKIRAGQTMKLFAMVAGRPEPTVDWLFAGQTVDSSAGIKR